MGHSTSRDLSQILKVRVLAQLTYRPRHTQSVYDFKDDFFSLGFCLSVSRLIFIKWLCLIFQFHFLFSADFCNLCTSNKQHFTVPYHIKEYANQVSQSEVSSHFIV